VNDDGATRVRAAIRRSHEDAEFVQACAGLPHAIRLMSEDGNSAMALGMLHDGDSRIALYAKPDAWLQFTESRPLAGFHSFTAAIRDPARLRVEGSPVSIAQSLHALERFFEIMRGQMDAATDAPASPALDSLTGRYARLGTDPGRHPLIYYERAGTPGGPPLLMLHTAGADGRQFHHLMADPALQANWDMFAFDLPAHGKSMPVPDTMWQGYKLDKQTYSSLCADFIDTVICRPAVLLGCSMGAAMALHLGKSHPGRVSGIVALEAPYQARGRKAASLAHPQVNQAAHNPSYVRGLMGPASPLRQRRAAAWIYSQGGFQVYAGDLTFYSEEFDAETDIRALHATSKPVPLLTGAYDYSASPEDSKRVADLVPGARFTEMPDLGHFPMIEHPDALLVYLRPVLQDIRRTLDQGYSNERYG
jgi:pimeloyl-ACP methyl ester carboxylesterase